MTRKLAALAATCALVCAPSAVGAQAQAPAYVPMADGTNQRTSPELIYVQACNGGLGGFVGVTYAFGGECLMPTPGSSGPTATTGSAYPAATSPGSYKDSSTGNADPMIGTSAGGQTVNLSGGVVTASQGAAGASPWPTIDSNSANSLAAMQQAAAPSGMNGQTAPSSSSSIGYTNSAGKEAPVAPGTPLPSWERGLGYAASNVAPVNCSAIAAGGVCGPFPPLAGRSYHINFSGSGSATCNTQELMDGVNGYNEVVGVAGSMTQLGTYSYGGTPMTALETESQAGVQVQEVCTSVTGTVNVGLSQ